MDIGNEYTNHTWAQLVLPSSTRSLPSLKNLFDSKQLKNILLHRTKSWKRHALSTLQETEETFSFDTSLELCTHLFLQCFVLTIVEKKGWLGVSESSHWGAGPRDFLLQEWNRIQPRGENYWLSVLRPLLLAMNSSRTLSSRYNDIRLPELQLQILKEITDKAIPNSLFWDPNHGLFSILSAFPIILSPQEHHSILHINEEDLRALLEDILSRGEKSEYKNYHTPSVLSEALNRQAIESYLLSQIQRTDSISDPDALTQAVSHWMQTGNMTDPIKVNAHRLSQWLQGSTLDLLGADVTSTRFCHHYNLMRN